MRNNRDGQTGAWLIAGAVVSLVLLAILSRAGFFPRAATIGAKLVTVTLPSGVEQEQQTLADGLTPHGESLVYAPQSDGTRLLLSRETYYRGHLIEHTSYHANGAVSIRMWEPGLGEPFVIERFDEQGNRIE